ncbi:hypothetical protein [Prosthecobacter sp.]|jgi:hypothetical protein|uniref:hypothetical protein n=1 Tax=Prosthecobacter sp. TaxID=1965333 RepID=UPI0037836F57
MLFRLSKPFQHRCILFFGTVHLIFLAVSILPREWTDGSVPGKLSRGYEYVTTCLQDWSMFKTIPNVHRLNVHLTVASPGKPVHRVGMRVPGLLPFPQPEHARYCNWVTLVLHRDERSDQREPYMRQVAAALLKTGKYPPETLFQLDCETWYTRSLLGVRNLREIAVKKTTTMGPFKLRDLAPAAQP